MKKSIHINLKDYFTLESIESCESTVVPSITISFAETSYWKSGLEEVIIQEYDGRHGYLYSLDVNFVKKRTIQFQIDVADIHILYLLSSDQEITIFDSSYRKLTSLKNHRAQYLYLPPERYTLELPKGYSQIFGFYFSGKIFRNGNDRPYEFLYKLIEAHRNKSMQAVCSLDFKAGVQTKQMIEIICKNLKPHKLNNESFIYSNLVRLIELSLEKINFEHIRLGHDYRAALNASNLLKLYIEDKGQQAKICDLSHAMKLDSDTLNRLHKRYFGKSLRTLRNELLIEKAKEHLQSGITCKDCAYILQYNSPEAFNHFFKKGTGVTPGNYQLEYFLEK